MEQKDFWLNRRTIRRYTDAPIDDILLNSLINKAAHAPNTGNMQTYSVVVTRDVEAKRQLAKAHFNQPSVMSAPVVLTFCADFYRFIKWCKASDAHPGYDNFHGFVTALIDAVIFGQQFVTAAEMEGLGCCYLGTTTYNAPDIAKILDLPEYVVPVVTVTVGFPAEKAETSYRLPLEAIIHKEQYNRHSEEQIQKYYAPIEDLPQMKQFVAENKLQNLAQVFTDVRYTKEAYELYSRIYKDFINRQGYEF